MVGREEKTMAGRKTEFAALIGIRGELYTARSRAEACEFARRCSLQPQHRRKSCYALRRRPDG